MTRREDMKMIASVDGDIIRPYTRSCVEVFKTIKDSPSYLKKLQLSEKGQLSFRDRMWKRVNHNLFSQ